MSEAASVDKLKDDVRQVIADALASLACRCLEQFLDVGEADRYVRDNPWQSIGIAAGVAFVIGVLVGRR